ncbi:MAG: sigma-70 family RNA polymerase sigma factor [Defluviitaleaceae bacterium]|nr:sigma-70 family RNA polymerase sigma factor [Defluviitaleaceae bacterium]
MVETIGRKMVNITAKMDCSLELMYHQYHKSVYNYIAFRINNHHDAEELASDVFVKAIQGWKSYNQNFPLEGWLIGIAKNVVTDYLRKTMRRKILPFEDIVELVSAEKQPEEVVVINEESKKLMSAMVILRDKERQILSMKFATELKHSEIAEILNISESHVGVTAHRAMTKLRKFMEEENANEK